MSGGYSANLFIGAIDPLLAGLSEEAAHIIDPSYVVNPTANYYFLVVSTFLISFTGTWITAKIVEPRLGSYDGDVKKESIDKLSQTEKKGLVWSLITAALIFAFTLFGIMPEDGFLRAADGSILNSPLIKGVVGMLFIRCRVNGSGLRFCIRKI